MTDTTQLTDPAEICEAAIPFAQPNIEAMLGLAAFGSDNPFRDVEQCEPGVWEAFCRAMHALKGIAHVKPKDFGLGETYDVPEHQREQFLRMTAAWLREHDTITWVDDSVGWIENAPGRFQGKLKDPRLGYLAIFHEDSSEKAIEAARDMLHRVRTKHAVFVETKLRCHPGTKQPCEATKRNYHCKCGWQPEIEDHNSQQARDLVQAHVDEELAHA